MVRKSRREVSYRLAEASQGIAERHGKLEMSDVT